MSSFMASVLDILKFDPSVLPGVALFSLKAALFCVPFLLLGLFLERGVDGRVRIAAKRRGLKAALFLLSVAPLLVLGVANYVNTVRPALLAGMLERHPDLEGLMVMEGVWPSLLLVALVGLFTVLNLVEISRGDTSS